MVFLGKKVPPATDEDYIKLQGGKPQVKIENGLTVVTHNYEGGDGMVVRGDTNYGTVTINGKEFEINLVRDLHGIPCEIKSRKIGGSGYDRENRN